MCIKVTLPPLAATAVKGGFGGAACLPARQGGAPFYKHLFFDLDHTLWDFDANALTTLQKLFVEYRLNKHFPDFEAFFEKYTPINSELWEKYRRREIPKETLKVGRFYHTFAAAGFDDYQVAVAFAEDFIKNNPLHTKVLPHTFELLNYLKQRNYQMHIITNGFVETQHVKMERSGLLPYFKKIFISEEMSVSKPHPKFFEHAIKSTNARKAESLVIGDSLENDIRGAQNFGLDHVYLNIHKTAHNQKVYKEIYSLKELIGWL